MRIYKAEEKIVSTVLDLSDEDIQHLESVDYEHPETLELDSGVIADEVIEYASGVLDTESEDIQVEDPELQRAIDEFRASRGTHRKAVEPTPIPSVDDMLVVSEDSDVEEPLEPKKGLWSRILEHFKKPVEASQDFSSYFEDEEQVSESDDLSSESDERVSEPEELFSEYDEQSYKLDEQVSEPEELFYEYDEQPYKLELDDKDINSKFTEPEEPTFDNSFSFYPPLESVADQDIDSEELDDSYEGYSPIISVEPGDVPTRSTVNTEKVDKFYWVKLGVILFICSLLLGTSVYFAMNFRLIHVSGDSMYPTLKDGQSVIVQTNIEPSMGDIAVFKHTGTNIIKRVWGTPKGVSHIPEMCTSIIGAKGGVQDMYSVYCDVKLNGYYVVGDNVYNSQDSNSYGVLKPDSLVGVVRGVL